MKLTERERCKGIVYVRDCLRYSGLGKSGFSMHYNERRCKRRGRYAGYCKQHAEWNPAGRAALREEKPR